MTLTEYISGLTDNPYFGAGFGLFGVGAAAAVLRSAFKSATILFRRRYIMTLEVPCRDKSYHWLLQWITEKGARQTQHLSVETSFHQKDTGSVKTKYEFIPSIGTHFFRYSGNWIKVERKREQHTLDLHLGVPWETVTLTTFGRDKSLYYDILEEETIACTGYGYFILEKSARQMALKKLENRTMLYTATGSEWRPFGDPRKRRPLHSVVLDEGIKEKILQDILEFINNPGWYTDRGIPYRRGYLLYGPPGCGKTSFISALAGELQYGICILNLSERGLSDDRLNYLLAVAPQNTIILLEDIDSAFISREEYPEGKNPYEGLTRVSFSGLLNCLDGVASAEGRLLFMTTNYIERLDPALIRPGRVDVKEYVGHCTHYQVEQMFIRFYPELTKHSKEFANKVISYNKKLSPAQLQGFFMIYKSSGNAVLENIEKIWEAR